MLLSLTLLAVLATPVEEPLCAPLGLSRSALIELKAQGFAVTDDRRNELALALLPCLGSPDPVLRDGIAFEALSTWLRGRKLTPVSIRALADRLTASLKAPPDLPGFRRPFAALVLSEVVRTDRFEPVFSETELGALASLASEFLAGVTDYRGLDEKAGWRHGVAHGADLVLQLSLNPRVSAESLRSMLGALAVQVSPKGAVFYEDGEPERLARAALNAWRRGVLDDAWWQSWLEGFANPAPLARWSGAFETRAGLAQRHNRVAFLHALAFGARSAGDEAGRAFAARIEATLAQLPLS